ncbi:uncharacterized protein LOC126746783 isoform X2 [Anthonomus grandis grandis]|uniref:uncharacterized protein LOC126746783 isoform X2 n=1 Tax=Anthonomus grandis grandis TaxID=2921223 RepID=UPI002166155F|nr:uncharacterized protein LOC126746783 isoform X2 [Anthonomus grandis grandis]
MYCAMVVVFCFWAAVLLSRVFGEEMMVGNSINKPRKGVQPLWVQVNTNSDHVRCFCNLPPCVATGYMCKSSSGGCFSDLVNSTKTATYRARHGCIEYLTEAQRYECPIGDKDGQIHRIEGRRSLMVCCTNDMCNHIDNPTTRSLFNSTLDADVKRNQDQEIYLYSNSEVWFRAATIAVPICGAVILFVLIALAVKILKSENQNSSNKLGPALYVVPSEQKSDRWSDHPYKPCTIKKSYYSQVHPSAFLVRQDQPEDAEERPYHVPLLVPSRLGSISDSKNAKRNLLRCDSDSSIMHLDLEKSSEDFLVNANINGTEVDKFSKDEKLLMA